MTKYMYTTDKPRWQHAFGNSAGLTQRLVIVPLRACVRTAARPAAPLYSVTQQLGLPHDDDDDDDNRWRRRKRTEDLGDTISRSTHNS
jgi:hypothetical protein